MSLALVLCAYAMAAQPTALLEQQRFAAPKTMPTLRTTAGTQPVLQRSRPLVASAPGTKSGGASEMSSIINLSKNIVGSGVLALAGGVAAFSGARMAIAPALALLAFLCAVSGYAFSLIARTGQEVGANSYQDAWIKVFGERTAIIPGLTVLFKTYVGGLSYAIILGDSFKSIAMLANAPAWLCSSNTWIFLLSGLVLLPLSLMRDLSSLAIGSVLGTAGTLYTALFMWLRFFQGSYKVGGAFHEAIAESARPAFAMPGAAPLLNAKIFVLISMAATAFLAHYNAPKFYKELAEPADGSSKDAAFTRVCVSAFGIACLLCGSIMAGGFLTFGGASQGLILNSYATSDPLAFVARLGICASIIFSYPLNFVGLREGTLNVLGLAAQAGKTSVHVTTTLVLLCLMNGLALFVKDLGLVVSIGGALLGSMLVYSFPALMFIQATRQRAKQLATTGQTLPPRRRYEMYANMGLAGLGFFLAVVGVIMSLKKAGLL